jgi:hypothetical protein
MNKIVNRRLDPERDQTAARIWKHRTPLSSLRKAIDRGSVTLGFLGGSITEARPGHNWPEKIVSWLVERYPNVRFTVENAAIGATGSNLAIFRLERDILRHQCDIVFVEYAVNDYYGDQERRKRSREGVLRRLLVESEADVVLVYTYLQAMYAEMITGGVPDSIAELEQLGELYLLSSVWMGLYAFNEVQRGRMNWEEWLPDGLHPTHRGSYSYAESVIAFLEEELEKAPGDIAVHEETAKSTLITSRGGIVPDGALPEPLNKRHWEAAQIIPFCDVQLEGPWTIQRSANVVWIDRMLTTSAIGAKLRFRFRGRGAALGFEFGRLYADFRCSIDGAEPVEIKPERAEWCPLEGLYHVEVLAEELDEGEHVAELEIVHGNGMRCEGTRCRIAFLASLP